VRIPPILTAHLHCIVTAGGLSTDGSRWVRLGFGTPAAPLTFVLDGTFFVEVRVEGRLTFPRISAVTSTPTQVDLLVLPGSTFGAGKGSTTAGS
jgi:hypothetical protein